MRRDRWCRQGRKEGKNFVSFQDLRPFFGYLYFSLPPLVWIGIIKFFFLLGAMMTNFILPFSFLFNHLPQKKKNQKASLQSWPVTFMREKRKESTERWKEIYYFSWIETLLPLAEFPFLSVSLFLSLFPHTILLGLKTTTAKIKEQISPFQQRFCPLLTHLNPFGTLTSETLHWKPHSSNTSKNPLLSVHFLFHREILMHRLPWSPSIHLLLTLWELKDIQQWS